MTADVEGEEKGKEAARGKLQRTTLVPCEEQWPSGIRTWKELAREVKLVVKKEFLILRLQWRAKSQGAAEVKRRSNEGHCSSHGTSVVR